MDALGIYVDKLRAKSSRSQAQQELFKFVQWCGPERALSDIKPPEIGQYGEQVLGTASGPNVGERMRELKKFLAFANKNGLVDQNLAQHLRIPKAKSRRGRQGTGQETIELTAEGHSQMEEELVKLKARRDPIGAQIGKAAADKDVRENAPLEAAREELGLVEARISQIENTLKAAVLLSSSNRRETAVRLGSKVRVKNLGTGQETSYTVVSAAEANSLEGKISDASPVGKALMKRAVGQEVEVETPNGKLRYRVLRVSS